MARFDPLTRAERSARMARVRRANTKPELVVRRIVHQMGFRYSLRGSKLPGNPDLVFTCRHKVIFVHGCFWHQHGCRQYRMPKTRRGFWLPKLARNRARDMAVRRMLRRLRWDYLIIWECQLKRIPVVTEAIKGFLKR